ncbi:MULTISPECIES: DUF6705 family protein [Flavobacterium]|jgi:hypothetical protein|uniref:DUF6705 family protein n=1 Tax=Flavobacterium TaxID=237 RepID=UPI0022ABCB29|nr:MULTISPECIES: DUF6705 family protein [Flavobacterium]
MKKLIYLSVLLLSILNINAQKIVPLENEDDYKIINRNEQIYFKDVNNVLGKFVGTWKGTYGDKKYEFRIVKYTKTFKLIKYDKLLVRYIITDLNGNVIDNTTSLPDSSTYVAEGRYYINEGYYLTHKAKGGNCAQGGQMLLYVDESNKNAIKMDVIYRNEMGFVDSAECPNIINAYFPTGVIFNLIKQ